MQLYDLLDTKHDPLRDSESRVYGAVVLPVTGVDKDTSGGISVRVRIPWGKGIELSAVVAAPMAGQQRGLFALPRKGDNVLVVFEGGLVTRPIVIGSVWVGNDKAPLTNANDPEGETVLRTAAGQELRIDERKDSLTLTTKKGVRVVCQSDRVALESDSKGSAKVVVHADGRIELESNQSLKLNATNIELTAKADLKLTGTNVTITGNSACDIKSPKLGLN